MIGDHTCLSVSSCRLHWAWPAMLPRGHKTARTKNRGMNLCSCYDWSETLYRRCTVYNRTVLVMVNLRTLLTYTNSFELYVHGKLIDIDAMDNPCGRRIWTLSHIVKPRTVWEIEFAWVQPDYVSCTCSDQFEHFSVRFTLAVHCTTVKCSLLWWYRIICFVQTNWFLR